MNSPFVGDQAAAFAAALKRDEPDDDRRRVALAWRRAYGRAPTDAETAAALDFVAGRAATSAQATAGAAESAPASRRAYDPRAWKSLCRALFASDEFLYVD